MTSLSSRSAASRRCLASSPPSFRRQGSDLKASLSGFGAGIASFLQRCRLCSKKQLYGANVGYLLMNRSKFRYSLLLLYRSVSRKSRSSVERGSCIGSSNRKTLMRPCPCTAILPHPRHPLPQVITCDANKVVNSVPRRRSEKARRYVAYRANPIRQSPISGQHSS